MHPILKAALDPVAQVISTMSLEEAQVAPLPGKGRWCAQQIVEHLILSFELTSSAVSRQLKSGKIPGSRRSLLEFAMRVQTIVLGYMPEGVPAIRAMRPGESVPQSGAVLAERFRQSAEAMDELLVAARKKFGIQACGVHPMYGAMRVDEWRRYHAVHAAHHLKQLRYAIRYARTQKSEPLSVEQGTAVAAE